MRTKKWKNVKLGHTFKDGSIVEEIHVTQTYEGYKLFYTDLTRGLKNIVLSRDHLLLCDIRQLPLFVKAKLLLSSYKNKIPLKEDLEINSTKFISDKNKQIFIDYLYGKRTKEIKVINLSEVDGKFECYSIKFSDGEWTEVFILRTPISYEKQVVDINTIWLTVENIYYLLECGYQLKCGNSILNKVEYFGKIKAFCIGTNSGRYSLNGLIHHNSVAIRNVILHVIEHNNQASIALIDLKLTEFSMYKNMNGVVGVANTVKEALEILRIARKINYARNKELQKLGITDANEYVPHDPTNRIWITGREFDKEELIDVRVDGIEKQMSAEDIFNYTRKGELEVCFVENKYLPVNLNSVDRIYKDSIPSLYIVIDEFAELVLKTGVKTAEEKELDEAKDEILALVQSLTQLARSAKIVVAICTQRAQADVLPKIIQSNCPMKMSIGKVDAISSQMILGDSLGTTVDGSRKGAAILKSNGMVEHIQVYFAKPSWIYEYYKDRGLNKFGYYESDTKEEAVLEDLEGFEDIRPSKETIHFEFDKEEIDIDKRKEQRFEEI